MNPDYVTLSVGGNDYGSNGAETTGPVNRVDATVTYIQQLRPASNVLLATLFYRNQATKDASGNTVKVGDLQNTCFNPAIPRGRVQPRAGWPACLLRGHQRGDPGQQYGEHRRDGIHPLTSGYTILATTWYNVLAFGSAYWTGSQDGRWSTVNAGGATNFAQNHQLTTPRQNALDAATDVYFNNNTGALPTTLGADLSVRGVNFAAGAAGPVTVGGGNILTIGAGGHHRAAGHGRSHDLGQSHCRGQTDVGERFVEPFDHQRQSQRHG